MDEVDKRRLRKAQMLEVFSTRKKKHFITVLLAVSFGCVGAQRIYLGQYALAVGIFVLFLFTLIGVTTEKAQGLVAAYICVVLFEIAWGTNATDKVNNKIRSELEGEFKLND